MKNINLIKNCKLFDNMTDSMINDALLQLNCIERQYEKDEIIISAGDSADKICIILDGEVAISRQDYWGNRSIIAALGKGEIFAEAFSLAGQDTVDVFVTAKDKTLILMLETASLTGLICSADYAGAMLKNMLILLAEKNVNLTRKIRHLTGKSTRERVMSYLSECAVNNASNMFAIPFDRQELADYLSVERSALSAVLSQMKRDGLIDYHKNIFKCLNPLYKL